MLKVGKYFWQEYSVHEKLRYYIKVVNGDTKEVIMEYPPRKY